MEYEASYMYIELVGVAKEQAYLAALLHDGTTRHPRFEAHATLMLALCKPFSILALIIIL